MTTKYEALIERFLLSDAVHSAAARMILRALQEDAIESLADTYYAGVSDEQAIALLELIAEIGGYEALNMLRDIVRHELKRRDVRLTAAAGLLHNSDNLSKKERKTLERFVSKYASRND